jgi:hypothetical protein
VYVRAGKNREGVDREVVAGMEGGSAAFGGVATVMRVRRVGRVSKFPSEKSFCRSLLFP